MHRNLLLLVFFLPWTLLPARAGNLRVDGQFISDAPQGTAPLQVDSTTPVPNLNADLLDGMTAADFAGVSELATAGSGIGVHWKNLLEVPGVEIDQDCAVNTGCETGTDSAGFPVTITEPGSYRLAGNLMPGSQDLHTISIEASNVTLDLNGFALIGPVTCAGTPVTSCTPTGGSGDGVRVLSTVESNVTIMNGAIQGMGNKGIQCFTPCRISNIHVSQSDDAGIGAFGGAAVVENVIAYRNRLAGIGMNGTLRDCETTGNGNNGVESTTGISIQGCVAAQNGSNGFSVRGTVVNSRALENEGNGFFLSAGTVVIGNSSQDNGQSGFVGAANPGLTFRGNTAHSNDVHGFDIDQSMVVGNSASENGDDGFVCGDCVLLDNLSVGNITNGVVFEGTNSVWGGNTLIGNAMDETGTVSDRGNNICDGAAC